MTMIHVTLPDGTVNEYAAGITCGEVITDALGLHIEAELVRGVVDLDCEVDLQIKPPGAGHELGTVDADVHPGVCQRELVAEEPGLQRLRLRVELFFII